MPALSWKTWRDYKSPLRVVVAISQKSRECKDKKIERLRRKLDEAERRCDRQEKEMERLGDELRQAKDRVRTLESQARRARLEFRLPDDPPIGTHGYGPRMVALAVEVAKAVGLRAAERVLKVISDFWKLDQRIPDWTTIRIWTLRLGVAALREPIEKADDWVWMLDHSIQIGPEKTLVVLGVRASKLPPPGTPLRREDMRLLDVRTDSGWNKEKMNAVYDELVERFGPPRAVLSDGAAELREGAKALKIRRSDAISLQDFKHKAANVFKRLVDKDQRLGEFLSLLGQTRSAIQQTELAHLTPPSMKIKSRFMNMKSRLNWSRMILWLLDSPDADARRWASDQRLEEKLGALRSYADEIAAWSECEQVIETGVTFINEQGLFRGAAERLCELFKPLTFRRPGLRMAQELVAFVAEAETNLKEGERLPMSTEILESTFGRYKRFEGQHAKSGFTSLIAALGALMRTMTPDDVRRALASTSVADVKQWTQSQLGETLTFKRTATYNEFHKAACANILPETG